MPMGLGLFSQRPADKSPRLKATRMAAGACEQEGAAWVGAATDAFRQTPAATELRSLHDLAFFRIRAAICWPVFFYPLESTINPLTNPFVE
jgi:hypothetical protein